MKVELLKGDNMELLKTLPDNSVDSVVTDDKLDKIFDILGWSKRGSTIKLIKNLPNGLTEKEYIDFIYRVDSDGRVYNRISGKEVSFSKNKKGYLASRLYTKLSTHDDNRKNYRAHRLVAMFYLSDYSDDLQVNHKNGIKTDNRVENLEMVNNSQNAKHAWDMDLDTTMNRRAKLNKCPLTGKFLKKNKI